MKKIWLFRLIALAIPLGFFLLLELGLRLAGFGDDYSLFIENPEAPAYLLPRPDVVQRYFPPGVQAPPVTIETNFFLKEKPENGLRIFVQGGSTAAGFPFGLGASLAGMLDYRLKQSFPDRPVEVINTALAAVNSYTLLDFSDEILAQQPDAILIYAGHNEYLGILGVGSNYSIANSPAITRLFLTLRKLRLFQAAQYIYAKAFIPSDTTPETNARTTMARIARHKNIAFDSALYHRGLGQFRHNMRALVKKYQQQGIPVFIATVASNLADQPPFVSQETATLDGQSLLTTLAASSHEDLSETDIARYQAVVLESTSAELHFAFGRLLYALGDYARAKTHFVKARDLDQLRFRAPSAVNDVILELADQHSIYLVDAHAALEQQAEHQIIGEKLMLEHVHPTVEGYFWIADAFYHALQASGTLGQFPHLVATASAQQEIPVFPAEEYWGRAKIADLLADYPFTESPATPALPPRLTWHDQLGYQAYRKKIGWLQIAAESMQRYQKDPLRYAMAAKLIADAVPNRGDYSYNAGVSLIRAQRPQEAPRYLLRAAAQDENDVNSRLALIHAYLLQNRPKDAVPWVHAVLAIDPQNAMAREVADKLELKSLP